MLIKKALFSIYRLGRNILFNFLVKVICPVLPLRRNIFVFNNFFGKGYDDNPAFIAEAIYKVNKDIKLYWVVKNKDIKLPEYVRPLYMKSMKEALVMASAKVRISNIRNYFPIKIKKHQLYIQTWHGSNGLKLVEGQIENKLDSDYLKWAKYDGEVCSAIVSSSQESDERYLKYFYLNSKCEILKYGFPRRDFLINNMNNTELKHLIRSEHGIETNDFVIVYAPTFRDNGDTSVFLFDYNSLLNSFSKQIGKKCKLIIKLHPNDSSKDIGINYCDSIINGNSFNSLNDLILIGDLLITDYSSIYYEFMLLNIPIIFYVPDYNLYSKTRGSSELFFKLPFAKVYTVDELFNFASEFNYQKHKTIISDFHQKFKSYDDGNASINIANWILNKVSKNEVNL